MKYRKKPVVIEAYRFDGGNIPANGAFAAPPWVFEALAAKTLFYGGHSATGIHNGLFVKTLEGNMHVSTGDFIIQGVQGEIYPCKPEIFEMTYEVVEEEK